MNVNEVLRNLWAILTVCIVHWDSRYLIWKRQRLSPVLNISMCVYIFAYVYLYKILDVFV